MTDSRAYSSERLSASRLEREVCVKLNLAPSSYGGEYSADVFGKITCCIFENSVSIPSQGERTLRVTRDRKIRMIEQIVGLRSESNLRAFRQLEALLKRQMTLCETRPAQNISPSIAELT